MQSQINECSLVRKARNSSFPTEGKCPIRPPAPVNSAFELLHLEFSPGDPKKRGEVFSPGMPFPRVIPHSDGGGEVAFAAKPDPDVDLLNWGDRWATYATNDASPRERRFF